MKVDEPAEETRKWLQMLEEEDVDTLYPGKTYVGASIRSLEGHHRRWSMQICFCDGDRPVDSSLQLRAASNRPAFPTRFAQFAATDLGIVGDKIPSRAAAGTIGRASPSIRCNTSGKFTWQGNCRNVGVTWLFTGIAVAYHLAAPDSRMHNLAVRYRGISSRSTGSDTGTWAKRYGGLDSCGMEWKGCYTQKAMEECPSVFRPCLSRL